jgi:phage tail sheath protein FI
MPSTLTYPGVYIEELTSGVHTITGVATSITAFVGRCKRGPIDADEKAPVTINSFADFERIFGGLWAESPVGFAVRDFYLNGGSQAIIVRLFHATAGTNAAAVLIHDTLSLSAANPGAWGNKLRVRVDYDTRPRPDGTADPDLFNLSVRDGDTGEVEVFRNISMQDLDIRRVDRVLRNESKLVRAVQPVAGTPRPGSHPAPQPGEDVWADNTIATNEKVQSANEASDGDPLVAADYSGSAANKTGINALEKADLFNLLCLPPYSFAHDVDDTIWGAAASYCESRRAMLIVDPPETWADKDAAKGNGSTSGVAVVGTNSRNAAVFFPRLKQPNPLRDNQVESFVPCGAVAGVFARTDAQRGVWKAPAGLEAGLIGVPALSVPLTDAENGELNPLGINCLRSQPGAGRVVWGARTLQGNDRLASEWKYIPVRRTALFLEESLYRGTQWVVFEPNDEPLWAQIRLNLGAFMHNLFRQGAFQGKTPKDAYFVKCDKETTTQTDINLGIVNILVGFAPLKPAEFVVIKIQQMAGQIEI